MAKCGWKESGTAMFRWPASIILVILAIGTALAQQTPTIRVNVNLVHVTATVKNRAGDLVGSLRKEDFEIYDNGVRQDVAVFERRTEQPLSIALIMDTSGSTGKDMHYEITAAQGFLRALLSEGNPGDAVALYCFNYDVTVLQGFTRNYPALERQFKLLRGEGGSSVYDAIFFAARDLENREGRKVVVIVTDGGDTTSARTLKDALKEAQLADAVVYPVIVMPITNDAGRNVGGENAMTFMAQGTGGRTFLPTTAAQLDRAFADIIMELRTQYLIGFYPHNAPLKKDPFHKLDVKVRSPELQVSARNGYYGESEASAGPEADRISVSPDRPRVIPDRKKKER
jgi:Ca-activated chloride channel family protein